MATTYTARGLPIRIWPTAIKPSEIAFNIQANTGVFSSPYTRTTQTVAWPGALVMLEAGFPPLRAGSDAWRDFAVFVAQLRGRAGRFVFPAYTCRYAPPAPLQPERITMIPLTVDTTYITADSTRIRADATVIQMESVLTASACPNSVTITGTLWLNSHRFPLQIGGWVSWDDATGWRHLHQIVGLDHDPATGAATLTVEPTMRSLPTPSTAMHVHAPSGIFQLADDAQGFLSQSGRLARFSVSAVQSFPVEVTA